ncbi:MAG: Rieske (2Fe-2S) protein [Bacillota bacterium]
MEYFVTDIKTLKLRGLMQVEVAYRTLLIIYKDNSVYAIQDECPHQGNTLSTGKVEGDTIKCKEHGLPISFKTGEVYSQRQADFLRLDKASRSIQTYPVVMKDDKIYIKM